MVFLWLNGSLVSGAQRTNAWWLSTSGDLRESQGYHTWIYYRGQLCNVIIVLYLKNLWLL